MVTSSLLNSVVSLEMRADGEEEEHQVEDCQEEGIGGVVVTMDETAEVHGEGADPPEIAGCHHHVIVEVEITIVTETTIVAVGTTVLLHLVEVVLPLLVGIFRDLKDMESIPHTVLMGDHMDLPLMVDQADMAPLLPMAVVVEDMVVPQAHLDHQELAF